MKKDDLRSCSSPSSLWLIHRHVLLSAFLRMKRNTRTCVQHSFGDDALRTQLMKKSNPNMFNVYVLTAYILNFFLNPILTLFVLLFLSWSFLRKLLLHLCWLCLNLLGLIGIVTAQNNPGKVHLTFSCSWNLAKLYMLPWGIAPWQRLRVKNFASSSQADVRAT